MRHSLRSIHIPGRFPVFVVLLLTASCQHQPRTGPARPLTPAEAATEAESRAGQRSATSPQTLIVDPTSTVRVRRFEELLDGKFPGVRVSRGPGGEFVVRIRGAGSFQGAGEPLFLLDGMAIPGSALRSINPADVAKIQVIKDGSAAFYGSRGANGVILISTTRPGT
jgi:TonB-dependent SusC/RagA subfamily outer membrane receptor